MNVIKVPWQERVKRKNRTRLEIAVSMLCIAEEGIGKTQLMYRGNFSFSVLHKYLKALIKANLIEKRQETRNRFSYRTTARGLQFIRNYQELQKHSAKIDITRFELEKFFPNSYKR